MKGKRYTEEQIVHILQDVERGTSVLARGARWVDRALRTGVEAR